MATSTTRKTPAPRKPAARKTPQDRKPAAPTVKAVDGGREVTVQGITVTVAQDALDDFELLDLMGRAEEEQNPALLPELLRRLVGQDTYRKVLDHLRDKGTGRVQVAPVVGWVNALMGALNPNS